MSTTEDADSETGLIPQILRAFAQMIKNVHPKNALRWLKSNRVELLSGVTVALTVIPTAIAFSFLAELDPQDGLSGAWMIALAMAVFGTQPAMVYCNAGAVAVVVAPLSRDEGAGHVFYCFMLSGIIMCVLGLLQVGRLLRLLPASVMVGFVNGLCIIIFLAQFQQFKADPTLAGGRRLNSFDVLSTGQWVNGAELGWMIGNVLVTMVASIGLPRLTRKVPAALCAIAASTAFEWAITRAAAGSETKLLRDVAEISGGLPVPIWLDSKLTLPTLNGQLLTKLLPTAITVTAVALIESLGTVRLVAEIIDERALAESVGNHVLERRAPDLRKEAFWMGVANIAVGALGSQGGCSEMGLTQLNMKSGGTKRLATALAALLTRLCLLALSAVLDIIPLAGFAGVLFAIALVSFEWSSLLIIVASIMPKQLRRRMFRHRQFRKIPRVDALIIAVVTIVTPLMDLAIAVGIGCGLAAAGFAWQSAHRLRVVKSEHADPAAGADGAIKVYEVEGLLYYAATESFLSHFDPATDPHIVELDLQRADLCDYSGMQAVGILSERYEHAGKHLRIISAKPDTIRALNKQAQLLTPQLGLQDLTTASQLDVVDGRSTLSDDSSEKSSDDGEHCENDGSSTGAATAAVTQSTSSGSIGSRHDVESGTSPSAH